MLHRAEIAGIVQAAAETRNGWKLSRDARQTGARRQTLRTSRRGSRPTPMGARMQPADIVRESHVIEGVTGMPETHHTMRGHPATWDGDKPSPW